MACGPCDDSSAEARAKQKPETSPNDCAILVIHQVLALKYLNYEREGIKEGLLEAYISTLILFLLTSVFDKNDDRKILRVVLSIYKSFVSMVLKSLRCVCLILPNPLVRAP